MARPLISFLTDFGADGAAAICRGVMLSIAPDAQILALGRNQADAAAALGIEPGRRVRIERR
jgi:S-adenosylmethionine hydrolase